MVTHEIQDGRFGDGPGTGAAVQDGAVGGGYSEAGAGFGRLTTEKGMEKGGVECIAGAAGIDRTDIITWNGNMPVSPEDLTTPGSKGQDDYFTGSGGKLPKSREIPGARILKSGLLIKRNNIREIEIIIVIRIIPGAKGTAFRIEHDPRVRILE